MTAVDRRLVWLGAQVALEQSAKPRGPRFCIQSESARWLSRSPHSLHCGLNPCSVYITCNVSGLPTTSFVPYAEAVLFSLHGRTAPHRQRSSFPNSFPATTTTTTPHPPSVFTRRSPDHSLISSRCTLSLPRPRPGARPTLQVHSTTGQIHRLQLKPRSPPHFETTN